MSELPVPLSASKLKQFTRCPEAFRLGYIEGLRSEGGENRYIRRGNAVHDAIEDVLSDVGISDDADYLKHRLLEQFRSNAVRADYALSEEDTTFVKDALRVAARFIAKQDGTVRSIEGRAEFAVSGLQHPEGFTGYIDVATDSEVWDWKTGKSEGKELDETLQGGVYMAGYHHAFGEPPEAIKFVYLKEEEVRTLEPSDEMWSEVVGTAKDLLRAVRHDEFPAIPGDSKCYWCDYEVHCDASAVGAGGIDWEAYP